MATLLSLRYAPDAEHAKTAAMDPSRRRHRTQTYRTQGLHANVATAPVVLHKAGLVSPLATAGTPSAVFQTTLSHSLDAAIMP